MTPAMRFLSLVSLVTVFGLGRAQRTAPFAQNGSGALGALQDHLTVSGDLRNSLGLRVPNDFVKDYLGDYKFQNPNILLKALLHSTYKTRSRTNQTESFEPLDYIGGFVLDYIVSRYVLMNAADKSQSAMARAKGTVLRQDSLAYFAVKNNFNKVVFVDRPIEKTQLREHTEAVRNIQNLADLKFAKKKRSFIYKFFKSVAGAIFVDSGYSVESVTPIYLKMIKKDLDALIS